VGAVRAVKTAVCALINPVFNIVFPDECRVCGESLQEVSRVPVCSRCLAEPAPIHAEFFCSGCRTPFVSRAPLDESGLCPLCRLGLSGFDAVYVYGSHEGALRKLVHLLKYSQMRPLAKPLGGLISRVLPREERFDLIVPMPLYWRRRWKRGFNQADLLAREIGRRHATPVEGVVRRVKGFKPQSGLTNAQRRANVSGAFRVKRGRRLDGMRVLLVDDVLTTGATAGACARALKRAGAAQVTLAAVARADRRLTSSYEPEFSTAPLVQAAGGTF